MTEPLMPEVGVGAEPYGVGFCTEFGRHCLESVQAFILLTDSKRFDFLSSIIKNKATLRSENECLALVS